MKNQKIQQLQQNSDLFLRIFLNSLKENNLRLEFDDPTAVEKCVDDLKLNFLYNQSMIDLKLNCYRLMYELDIASRKIVSSGCFVRPFDALKSEYSEIVLNNIQSLKKVFNQFSVVDIDSDLYLCWAGTNFFDINHYEGLTFSYHNSGSDYSNRIFFEEEYYNYFESCSLDCDFLNELFQLYYSSFAVGKELPVKHGFGVSITDRFLDIQCEAYHHYDRFLNYVSFFKQNFADSVISIQISSEIPESFCFEFQLRVNQYNNIINKLIECDCLNEDMKNSLLSVKFPEFIEYFVMKFKWEDSKKFNIKLYTYTENQDTIRSILGVDGL